MLDSYIETRSGIIFHFLDPKPEEIKIEDIAYALANQCRFNGHCSRFYSVAEHSVLVASLVEPKDRLAALLHDASEAYLSDIPSPIKQFLPDYAKMEDTVQSAINTKFLRNGEPYKYEVDWKAIKQADRQQLSTEAHYLLTSGGKEWSMWGDQRPEPLDGKSPLCLWPSDAFGLFMRAFESLMALEDDEPKIILEV